MDGQNNDNTQTAPVGNGAPAQPPADADATGLAAKLEALQEQVSKAHAAMERIERSRRIEQLLRAARAEDVAAAAELVEHTLAEGGGKMTLEAAIEQLQRKRPALFKRRASPTPPASAMSGRAPDATADDTLADLARRIGAGEHRSIMEYMRARRRR
jgi:hypothetical protein